MITRALSAVLGKSPKSILLLGPRQVGKSTLIGALETDLTVNLADELEFLNHSSQPGEIRRLIEVSQAKKILIDEVQRLHT